MIVVGLLAAAERGSDLASAIARRAASEGARVEILGVQPWGAVGDEILLDLTAAGVGHATVARSEAPTLDREDLDLALRYLPDVRVIVLARPSEELLGVAAAASGWTGAALIVIQQRGDALPDETALAGVEPIAIEAPSSDPDGAFAGLVASLAARIERGEPAGDAWRSTLAALAVDPA